MLKENHHPNKIEEPNVTIPLTRKAHQNLHGTEVKDTPIFRIYQQYASLTKQSASMKNWRWAYQKEYEGDPTEIDKIFNVKELDKLKYRLIYKMTKMIKTEIDQISHIKGVGPVTLAGILAHAHPNRFPSLRKFLFYCGYTNASRTLKKVHPSGKSNLHYNRKIPPIMFNSCLSIIKAKDTKYYPLYLKLKEDMKLKYPDIKSTHYVAINRLSTIVLKEIYSIFHGVERK